MNRKKAKFLRKLAQAHNENAPATTEYWSRATGQHERTMRIELFPSCTRAKYKKFKEAS